MTIGDEHQEVLDYIAAITGTMYELSFKKAKQFADSLDYYNSEGYNNFLAEELTKQDMGL